MSTLDSMVKIGINTLQQFGAFPEYNIHRFIDRLMEKHREQVAFIAALGEHEGYTADNFISTWVNEIYPWMKFAANGKPVYRLTKHLTSSILLTNGKGWKVEDLKFPFDSFVIELPENMIPLWGQDSNEETYVSHILVTRFEAEDELTQAPTERLRIMGYAADPHSFKIHLDYTLPEWNNEEIFQCEFNEMSTESGFKRLENDTITFKAMSRLVLGFLIWYEIESLANNRPPFAHKPHKKAKAHKERELPRYFVESAPIQIDPRHIDAARDFVRMGCERPRKGWEVSVQSVIPGQFYNQAHGPQWSQHRKWWRRPHVRGADKLTQTGHTYETK